MIGIELLQLYCLACSWLIIIKKSLTRLTLYMQMLKMFLLSKPLLHLLSLSKTKKY